MKHHNNDRDTAPPGPWAMPKAQAVGAVGLPLLVENPQATERLSREGRTQMGEQTALPRERGWTHQAARWCAWAMAALVLLVTGGWTQRAEAQCGATTIPYAWRGIGGTSVVLGDDQVAGPYNIGFNYTHFSNVYSQFYISSNGFIAFSAVGNGCCSGQAIPNAGDPNNLVAGFWEDLNPGLGGSITFQTIGTAPNRQLVVQYANIQHYGGGNPVTFQIVLLENGTSEVHCASCPSDGGAHTQGIENADGSAGYFVAGRNSTSFALGSSGTRFSTSGGPTWYYDADADGYGVAGRSPVRVAVVTSASGYIPAVSMANTLNQDLHHNFTASAVPQSAVDSAAELANYDVVVIGSSGYGDHQFDTVFGNALYNWVVTQGGGVVSSGWADYAINGDANGIAMDQVMPIDADVTQYAYCYSGHTLTLSGTHPIVQGINGTFAVPGAYIEYSSVLPDVPGAEVLGTANGGACSGGTYRNAVVAGSIGGGRSVYLGPLYTGYEAGYGSAGLRTDATFRRLFEQAVRWAGKGEGQGISACTATGLYRASQAGDCNDGNGSIYPGAAEICSGGLPNGVDDNCNGVIDEGNATYYQDADGDGYGNPGASVVRCAQPSGYVTNNTDCNDGNAGVYPGRAEVCDGLDNNCAGGIDEGIGQTWYYDADNDTYGTSSAIFQCFASGFYRATRAGDCNDGNANQNPGLAENSSNCTDGVDNNCNGVIDDGKYTQYRDADADGFGNAGLTTANCVAVGGYVNNASDCNDGNAAIRPGATEVCDYVDNNCAGGIDEGLRVTKYQDNDRDNYGTTAGSYCPADPAGAPNAGDCNDNNNQIYPGRAEVCSGGLPNGIDDNCNGSIDESNATYYQDADGDGFGNAGSSVVRCAQPGGYVTNASDCNDGNGAIRPGATEVCDNVDNNCAGGIDEGLRVTRYPDADGDGYGQVGSALVSVCPAWANYSTNNTDCLDSNASVNPGRAEVCGNGIDDNCAGGIDENILTFYRDADGDTWGSTAAQFCSQPGGYVTRNGDCNDGNAAIFPGRAEVCNGLDDNCAGGVDEGVTTVLYVDADRDTYGTNATASVCAGTVGYATRNGDCNDGNAGINPGVAEICGNGVDDNCAGGIDENRVTYYLDSDGDTWGLSSSTTLACTQPGGYTTRGGDCDDFRNFVNPGASEVCDLVDNNCNGAVDDGLPTTTYYLDADQDTYGQSTSLASCVIATDRLPTNNGLVFWADATQQVLANGAAVPTWADFSGGGRHATQGNAAFQPKYYTSLINGRPGIRFDGSDVLTTAASFGNPYTMFAVGRYLGVDNERVVTSLDYNWLFGWHGNREAVLYTEGWVVYPGDPGSTNPRVFAATGTGGQTSFWDHQTLVARNSNGVYPPGRLSLGAWVGNPGNEGSQADLGELIVFNRVLTDSEIRQVNLYLARKWGTNLYTATRAGDCNDANGAINPGVAEVCGNGVDDNCNSQIDENRVTYYRDVDGDGYGIPGNTTLACTLPSGYSTNSTDCNDVRRNSYPGNAEVCDGVDNNCNGSTDEGLPAVTRYLDIDQDGWGVNNANTACVGDYALPVTSGLVAQMDAKQLEANGTANGTLIPAWGEVRGQTQSFAQGNTNAQPRFTTGAFNGRPALRFDGNDILQANFSIANPYSLFVVGRYTGVANGRVVSSASYNWLMGWWGGGVGGAYTEGWVRNVTAADTVPHIYALTGTGGQTSFWENQTLLARNANGVFPPGVLTLGGSGLYGEYSGADLAEILVFNRVLNDAEVQSVNRYLAHKWGTSPYTATQITDCNDTNGGVYPGAPEVCGNGIDDNCNGSIDENILTFYRDADGDTYGTTAAQFCAQPGGYATRAGDCNDGNANINPGRTEVCNGVDDNCVGGVDEGLLVTLYRDADGDTYGTSTTATLCPGTAGYATRAGDCNDGLANINPAASEICDGQDNNCNGSTDEGLPTTTYYLDNDQDTWGTSATQTVCQVNTTLPITNGLTFWVDAQRLGLANGTPVPTWTDYSGGNRHASQGNAAYQPKYYSNIMNGRPGIRFDGNDVMTTAASFGNPYTIFAVGRYLGVQNQRLVTSLDYNWLMGWWGGNESVFYAEGWVTNPYLGATNTVRVFAASGDGGTSSMWNNQTLVARNSNGVFPPGRLSLGAHAGNPGAEASQADLGEVIVFNRVLTDAEIQNMNAYLTRKWSQTAYTATRTLDCNDANASVNPGMSEVCGNNLDDNCNGQIDENIVRWYRDLDGDAYGDPNVSTLACTQPGGYLTNNTDCNDNSIISYPGVAEVCDGLDNNCNGSVDDGLPAGTYYQDQDDDTWGTGSSTTSCRNNPPLPVTSGLVVWVDAQQLAANNVANNTPIGSWTDRSGVGNHATQPTAANQPRLIHNGINSLPSIHFRGTDVLTTPTNYTGDYTIFAIGRYLGADNERLVTSVNYNWLMGWYGNREAVFHPGAWVRYPGDVATNQTRIFAASRGGGQSSIWDGQTLLARNNAGLDPTGRLSLGAWQGSPTNETSQAYLGEVIQFNRQLSDLEIRQVQAYLAYKWGATSYTATRTVDCVDTNGNIYPGAVEICNGIDDDCDGQVDEGVRPTWYRDVDGDLYGDLGVPVSACTQPGGYVAQGGDCNDNNAAINPGRAEACNGIDDDCDTLIDEGLLVTRYRDADGDNYGHPTQTGAVCPGAAGWSVNNTDCNDGNAAINPAATEVCDYVDNDCDSLTDEGVTVGRYRDVDGDNYGAGALAQVCTQTTGYVAAGGDCNDAVAAINPGATEPCVANRGDNIDNNCNGTVDENLTTFYVDADSDNYGTAVTDRFCVRPALFAPISGDCNDGNASINPGRAEVCNGIDDNCAGGVDEGLLVTRFRDNDGDNYGTTVSGSVCPGTAGWATVNTDCDDTRATVNPGAAEVCGNNLDDNCNTQIDENRVTYYQDTDADTYGSTVTQLACTQPVGYTTRGGDCVDTNAAINPGRAEVCNYIDDNCVGGIDEGLQIARYRDVDGDNYGAGAVRNVCPSEPGYVTLGTDCNDGNAAINPGAAEVCNSLDDDCDAQVDEGLLVTRYRDVDGDNYGAGGAAQVCPALPGYSTNNTDCNDNNAAVNPGRAEVCGNGIDDNCAGGIDENIIRWYRDADGDTYGNAALSQLACTQPGGFVVNSTDCNDAVAAIRPGATEVCNEIDDNCSGAVDEGIATQTFYYDEDNDTYGLAGRTPVRVAVVRDPSAQIQTGVIATLLNQDTYHDFSAVAVDVASVDSAAELANYDLVIIGNPGNSPTASGFTQAFADALYTWVNTQGGGVISSGWMDYGTAADAVGVSIDRVVPVDADNYSYTYCSSPMTLTLSGTHPVVQGINGTFVVPGAYMEYSPLALDIPGATRLGVPSCDGSGNAVAVADVGLGRVVYLGPLYSANSGYGNAGLFSGTFAQLFGQAAKWAGKGDRGVRVACGPNGLYRATRANDCNDLNGAVNPGVAEVCSGNQGNGIDDNCNGTVDENTALYYADVDRDNYGNPAVSSRNCAAPTGYVVNNTDCNDNDNVIYPGNAEVCDNKDNNCSGVVDEGLRVNKYPDGDGDGYGLLSSALVSVCPAWANYSNTNNDCNDTNAQVYPGRAEICGNNIDDNCVGGIDENKLTFYLDADNDTYGSTTSTLACTQPGGYVTNNTDCNDGNAAIRPNATEVCDSVDNNCNAQIDEGLRVNKYPDGDGDTYGRVGSALVSVCPAWPNYSVNNTDCLDTNAAVNPGAAEICGNGLDDNCAGGVDENVIRVYRDFDADTYGNPANSILACSAGGGYVTNNTDCNDSVATINPGRAEVCNGVDDNCNTTVDDSPTDANQSCNSGLPGACAETSLTQCISGTLVCGPRNVNGFGTVSTVTVPGGLLGRNYGVVDTDWKLVTSNGYYFFNLAYGRNGTAYNGYTVRVFDPENNFAVVKTFQVGTTSLYIDGIVAKGDKLYAIEWAAVNGARVTEIDWRRERIDRITTINQGNTDAINGQYDWIQNVFFLGGLRNDNIYEHNGTEISAATQTRSFTVAQPTGGGVGTVASDGRFLYVKRWHTYPSATSGGGQDRLFRVGSGYGNTIRGFNYGPVTNDIALTLATSYHSDGYVYVADTSASTLTRVRVTDPRREVCGDNVDNNCNGAVDDYCPSSTPFDTFASLVPCNWNVVSTHGASTAPAVTGGELQANLTTGVSGQPIYTSGLTSRFALRGDFDIQVDYRIDQWNPDNGVRINLQAANSTVHRLNDRGGLERYITNFGGTVSAPVATAAQAGKLRMVRQGNTLIGYYDDGGWREISRLANQNTADTTVTLSIHGHLALPANARVSFDNFTINAGQLVNPAPLAVESCDGQDNDCDGTTDEDSTVACTTQCGNGVRACVGGALQACNARLPSAEICDDTVDNDCNGSTDEGCGSGFNPLDDFNDGNLASCRWNTATSPAYNPATNVGGRVDEANGKLRVRMGAATTGANFSAEARSRFGFRGDFDVQLDWSLTAWPANSHIRVGMTAAAATPHRYNDRNVGDFFVSNINSSYSAARPTTARAGSFRVVRVGNVLRSFVRENAGPWILDHQAAGPTTDTDLAITIWGHTGVTGDIQVDFDNLQINGCTQTPCRSWAGGSLINFQGLGRPEGTTFTGTCDAVDNDCDGVVDGFARACSTACGAGNETCTAGTWGACSAQQPITEVCDGSDNDCDTQTDESDPNAGTFCSVGGQQGVCAQGTKVCRGVQGLVCEGPQPGVETCDALDNDCDGTQDEVGNAPALFRDAALIGYWSFEERNGSTYRDNAKANNQGTVAGNMALGGAGRYGYAATLDGNADYGSVPANNTELDLDAHNQITISAWLHPTATKTGNAYTIYRSGSYYLTLVDGKPAFYGYGLTTPGYHAAPSALPLNQWTHVAATYNGSLVKVYVNGAEVYSAASTGGFQADANPLIFGTVGATDGFQGRMDEVFLFRRALTPTEINDLRAQPAMPGGGVSCATSSLGLCASGTTVCNGGTFACQAPTPVAELCNNLDDDCDGSTDENNPQGGGACLTNNVGVCRTGTFACTNGALACQAPQPGTITEVCDGADNDCDGSTDESFANQGVACNVGGALGVCARGTLQCVGGVERCVGPQPATEVCDNVDNDCDGQTDEQLTRACSTQCGGGTEACSAGTWGGCTARQPTPEICDNVDNDCDGSTDESIRRSCRSACGGGTEVCSAGRFLACSAPQPAAESCDGLDNNCNGLIDDAVSCGCQYFPTDQAVRPSLEWMWTGSTTQPNFKQVSATPVVANLDDNNNDGRINTTDTPDIVFSATDLDPLTGGYLRAINGNNGSEKWTYTARKVAGGSSPAIGDLDDDGVPEVVAYTWRDTSRGAPNDVGLVILNNQGQELYTNADVNRAGTNGQGLAELGSPAIANIDPNTPGNEIATCFWLVSATGQTLWNAWSGLPNGYTPRGFCSPAVADVDGNGFMDVVVGARAYSYQGQILWTNSTLYAAWGNDFDIAPAIADLDGDGRPEIVVVRGRVYVLRGSDGQILADAGIPNGGQGGAPNLADFDGDGLPDIGVAGSEYYVTYKLTRVNNTYQLTQLWQRQVRDFSSSTTGSTVFDFNGDSIPDIVYNDELYLRVLNGRTGAIVFEERNWNGTQVEYPVIVDVDNDNHAEIVVGRSQTGNFHDDYGNYDGTPLAGLRVYGDAGNTWLDTRNIWNQYTYHVTNVTDVGGIPATETSNWTQRNTNSYRANFQGGQGLFAAADLNFTLVGVTQGGANGNYPNTTVAYCPPYTKATVRVCNEGDAAVTGDLEVALYAGNPDSGGQLLATKVSAVNLTTTTPNNCTNVAIDFNSTLQGNYNLFVRVDNNRRYNECDEGDNTASIGTHALIAVTQEKCDGIDDNCNQRVDEDVNNNNLPLSRPCTTDCGNGTQTCGGGAWGTCSAPVPSAEICDAFDNDCNGRVNDGYACPDSFVCRQVNGNYQCVAGVTVSSECAIGCPLGTICGEEGTCTPYCETDYGCPEGEVCGDGNTCIPDETASFEQSQDGAEEQDPGQDQQLVETPLGSCASGSFARSAAPVGGLGALLLLAFSLSMIRIRRK